MEKQRDKAARRAARKLAHANSPEDEGMEGADALGEEGAGALGEEGAPQDPADSAATR